MSTAQTSFARPTQDRPALKPTEGQPDRRLSVIRSAMNDTDRWALKIAYADSKGQVTVRVVSPIRMVGSYRLLALCLCREEPRMFQLSGCLAVQRIEAASVIAPVPIEVLSTPDLAA